MHLVIFEDDLWPRLAPLSLTRPIFTLTAGMSSLLEKQLRHIAPSRLTLWVRDELAEYCRQTIASKLGIPTTVNEPLPDERVMLIHGATLHYERYQLPPTNGAVVDEQGRLRTILTQSAGLTHHDALQQSQRWQDLLNLPRLQPQARMVTALWDLITWNRQSLTKDGQELHGLSNVESAGPYDLLNAKEIWQSREVKIEPGCVLDGREGPIVLGDGATIGANTVIKGPAYIGPYAYLRPVSLIRPGTTIGAMCKVGGEISNSIMLGWSNKSHDGYLGNSYVGKWVNLGALTTTSNVKNTFGQISVDFGSQQIDTGTGHLGSLIGDHVKTAILTRLMSGSYVGFNCMLACSQIAPKHLPSLSFITDDGRADYDLEKAIAVARRMYDLVNHTFDELEENIFRYAARAAREIEQPRQA